MFPFCLSLYIFITFVVESVAMASGGSGLLGDVEILSVGSGDDIGVTKQEYIVGSTRGHEVTVWKKAENE